METWKKVIVSGSDISQLANDANYLVSGDTVAALTGSFSGSFVGNGAGLTGVPASGIDLAALSDGNGIADFTYDGSSVASVTVEVNGTTLSVDSSGVKVADLGVDTAQLAAGAVTTLKIADANVTEGKLATSAVTTAKIADTNVTEGKLATDAVSTDKIADLNVTTGKLALLSVDTAQLAAGAVTAAKIDALAVTTAAIDTAAVTSAKIAADSITVAQLSGSAVITAAEGIGSNDVDTAVPTAAAVKAYADSVVGASDLDFAGDSGTGAVDLDSQTFTVAGGDGLTSAATGQTVTLVISESGVTNDMLEGSIGNDKLSNSSITIGDQSTSLGGTITAFSGSFTGDGSALTGVTADTLPNSITDGNGIADFTFNGSSAASVAVQIDGSTLAVSSTGVKVADAGVTETQIVTSVAGTGLSGGAGTALSVDYGSLANTAAQGNVTIEVAGTTNEIEITGGGSAALGTSRTITVGLPDDVTISGDLTVLGTASFQDTQNLAIADRFILLASGSNTAGDGGIVVQQTTQDIGDVFAYENSVTRWGIGTAFNASDNSYTPDAFMAAVINTAGNDPNDVDAPDARYEKKGNLYVASNSEDIWIYS